MGPEKNLTLPKAGIRSWLPLDMCAAAHFKYTIRYYKSISMFSVCEIELYMWFIWIFFFHIYWLGREAPFYKSFFHSFWMNKVDKIEELLLKFYFDCYFLFIMNNGKTICCGYKLACFSGYHRAPRCSFYPLISHVSSLTNWILRDLTLFSLVPLGSTTGPNKELRFMHFCVLAINMNTGVNL